jgi:hypothetical protein
MKYHGLPAKEFVELDTKYHILDLIGDAYETFHLTGDEGVLEEIDEILRTTGYMESGTIEFEIRNPLPEIAANI